MRRQPKVRVSRRRGARTAQELAEALTAYLTGRTNTPPTIYISNSPKGAS